MAAPGVAARRVRAHGAGARAVRAGAVAHRQGRLCAASARKALPQLAAQLGLALPGNKALWRAYVQLQMMVRVTQADRAP